MTTGTRIVAATVALVLALGGLLASAALAQQPAQPAPYQETLKTSQASDPDRSKYEAGAAVINVAYVPGKAIVCGAGTLSAFGILALTFGHGYRWAVAAFREGCAGKWSLSADDIRPERGPDFSSHSPEPSLTR